MKINFISHSGSEISLPVERIFTENEELEFYDFFVGDHPRELKTTTFAIDSIVLSIEDEIYVEVTLSQVRSLMNFPDLLCFYHSHDALHSIINILLGVYATFTNFDFLSITTPLFSREKVIHFRNFTFIFGGEYDEFSIVITINTREGSKKKFINSFKFSDFNYATKHINIECKKLLQSEIEINHLRSEMIPSDHFEMIDENGIFFLPRLMLEEVINQNTLLLIRKKWG